MQYLAIGLLGTRYVPRDEISQGILLTDDSTVIEAVVLGKLLGLLKSVKAGIDLDRQTVGEWYRGFCQGLLIAWGQMLALLRLAWQFLQGFLDLAARQVV